MIFGFVIWIFLSLAWGYIGFGALSSWNIYLLGCLMMILSITLDRLLWEMVKK